MDIATARTTGELRIGDQWNAINIIAQSQTHPLKAVCELVENAIDARSENVEIRRLRKRGELFLEFEDDGNGLLLDQHDQPDFARIATHICDSMKRHLYDREGVHGEFGIGLLSFWSLGEQMRIVSAALDNRLYEMVLTRGDRSYEVRSVRGELATGGTRVIVGPLLPSTRNIVTGEKLERYLSAELRDRIRDSGVRIRILDRVARKDVEVVPKSFSGERLSEIERVETGFGDVRFELYLNLTKDCQGVAICKDGTRVLPDIADLAQFQSSPWMDGQLEGVVDFAALNLAPGTRSGIVPDERLQAFVFAVQSITGDLCDAIASREQAEAVKASQQVERQVKRAFVGALREMPANEYLFFDIPRDKKPGSKTVGSANASRDNGRQASLLPVEAGPLASVSASPRRAQRRPGESVTLRAKSRDENGTLVREDVAYEWEVVGGKARIAGAQSEACRIVKRVAGVVTVRVTATKNGAAVTDEVLVRFDEDADSRDSTPKTLPTHRLEAGQGESWRSRYDLRSNEIIVNSAHRDFLSNQSPAAKYRRYVGKLYAKEIVALNFPHLGPEELLERMVEIMVRTEESL